MTQTTTPARIPIIKSATPAIPRHTDFTIWFVRWIGLSQIFLYALPILITLSVDHIPKGVMGYVQRDYGFQSLLWVIPFLVSIGAMWAGRKARFGLLFILIGQSLFTGIALHYWRMGEVSSIGLAPHLGMWALNIIGILIAPLSDHPSLSSVHRERLKTALRAAIRLVIFIVLVLYAGGLLNRPESQIARGIQASWGAPILLLLVGAMGLGAGAALNLELKTAGKFIAVLIGQWFYALFGLSFLGVEGMSLIGTLSHFGFAVTSLFIMITWPVASPPTEEKAP